MPCVPSSPEHMVLEKSNLRERHCVASRVETLTGLARTQPRLPPSVLDPPGIFEGPDFIGTAPDSVSQVRRYASILRGKLLTRRAETGTVPVRGEQPAASGAVSP